MKFKLQQNEINYKMMRANQQKAAISEALALKTRKIIESEIALGQIKMIEQASKTKNFQKKMKIGPYRNLIRSPKQGFYLKNTEFQSPMKNLLLRGAATEFGC